MKKSNVYTCVFFFNSLFLKGHCGRQLLKWPPMTPDLWYSCPSTSIPRLNWADLCNQQNIAEIDVASETIS